MFIGWCRRTYSFTRCAQKLCQPFWITNKSTVASFVIGFQLDFQEHLVPSVRLGSGEAIFPETCWNIWKMFSDLFESNFKLNCWSLIEKLLHFYLDEITLQRFTKSWVYTLPELKGDWRADRNQSGQSATWSRVRK